MRVKILADNKRLGLKAGEVYEAKRYRFDPSEKMELIKRETDGYRPMCNVYIEQVAHWICGKWQVVVNNQYVPET